eukprot:14072780-Heterocapsa_arctica.AAC.1
MESSRHHRQMRSEVLSQNGPTDHSETFRNEIQKKFGTFTCSEMLSGTTGIFPCLVYLSER